MGVLAPCFSLGVAGNGDCYGTRKMEDTSIGGIKVAQTLIDRAERVIYDTKRTDPLPSLRDSCVQESNRRIHNYARATRAVVVHLRQVLVATNDLFVICSL